MPPHGKRRFSPLITILSLSFLFAYSASAASAVLGIDLGTEYIKAALVKPGIPLEIVLTKDSKRKEAAAVAFKPSNSKTSTSDANAFPERIYGADALALSARFPSDVYPNLKPLLGLQFKDSDVVVGYSGRHPGLRLVEGKDRGTIGFQSDSFDTGAEPFLVEELLAMELKNIRGNAMALAGKGSNIQDAVITVPSFYTAEERRAVTLAADLAGLRVLALISDGLSVGLNYATSRTFATVSEGGKPEFHLVYDMGAGSTTATILRFQGKTVKDVGKFNKTVQEVQILGTGWDKTLGGDALNEIVMEDMIQKFTAISRMKTMGVEPKHIKEHGRTMAKLWKEAERMRQVLSANTETSSSFEGLFYEDVNFKYKLSRTEFENLASRYAMRVQSPITSALESAKLSLSDIESVILHGGAVRTPFVQKQLEAAIKSADKIRTNVNSDEAAVFGAAFRAAGISPSFRVKDIRTGDIAGYAVGVSWTSDGKERQQKLFIPTSQTGAEKQVSLKVTNDLSFTLYEQIPATAGLIDLPVVKIQTLNLTSSVQQLSDKFGCTIADIKTQFAIRLSPIDGLPELVRGSVSCEAIEKKGGVVDGVKDFLGFGSKKGDQEPLKDEASAKSSTTSLDGESSTTSSLKESKTSDSTADKIVDEKPKDAKPKTQTIYLDFSTDAAGVPPLSKEKLQQIKDRLTEFDASDRSRMKREETLNTLEAFTYKARDLVEDQGFILASTEKQRIEIEEQFKSASEWLYGDGADASRETLKERLDHLRGLVDPIQMRRDESIKRPKEVKALQEALEQTKAMVSLISQNREAQSIAEEVASSDSATESSITSTTDSATDSETTEPPSSSITDDFADLDDDTTMTSSTTTSEPLPPPPPMPSYSADDLALLTEKQESVQKWLETKLADQEKLSPTDDPAFLSSDLAAKSKELNEVVMRLLQKQMQMPGRPKSSSRTKKSVTKKVTPKTSATDSAEKAEDTAAMDELFKKMPGLDKATEEEIAAAVKAQREQEKTEETTEEKSGEKTEKTEKTDKTEKTKEKMKEKLKERTKAKSKEKKKLKTKSKPKTKGKAKATGKSDHEEL